MDVKEIKDKFGKTYILTETVLQNLINEYQSLFGGKAISNIIFGYTNGKMKYHYTIYQRIDYINDHLKKKLLNDYKIDLANKTYYDTCNVLLTEDKFIFEIIIHDCNLEDSKCGYLYEKLMKKIEQSTNYINYTYEKYGKRDARNAYYYYLKISTHLVNDVIHAMFNDYIND